MDVLALLTVFALTLGVVGAGFAAMAIGRVLTGRCLRGSCGGAAVTGPKGERLACAACPNREKPPG